MENEIALRKFKIPHRFPDEILRMTEADISKFCVTKSDNKRVDLTEIDFFTVDGSDAKDFDDAIYVEGHKKGGWRALVAIADVSSYVHSGDPIDQEAFYAVLLFIFRDRLFQCYLNFSQIICAL